MSHVTPHLAEAPQVKARERHDTCRLVSSCSMACLYKPVCCGQQAAAAGQREGIRGGGVVVA